MAKPSSFFRLVQARASGVPLLHRLKLILKEELLLPKGRLQLVQPGGRFAVLGKERALYPVRVAALQEAQHEHLFAFDFGYALYFHLAGAGTHAGAAGGAGQAADLLHGVAVDVVGLGQGHFEVVLGAGVPLYKHVVGDDAQLHFTLPQLGPVVGVVVYVLDQRALGADFGTGGADAADGFFRDVGGDFLPVVVVGHDGHVLAGINQPGKQFDQLVGILVGHETVRPEGEGLGADADGLDVIEFRLQQGFQVLHQVFGFHHHGVATGHQQVGHFGVLFQVAVQLLGIGAGHFQVFVTNKLGPAEAEGAVAVAGLALGREKQHGLTVLVLYAVEYFAIQLRHVRFHLAGGVWVQFVTDDFGGSLDVFFVGTLAMQLRHLLVMFVLEHALLGEDELIDGVVRYLVPVDQFVNHVFVNPERQHAGYHFHFEQGVFREILDRLNFVELAVSKNLEPAFLEFLNRDAVRKGDDGVHRSPSVVSQRQKETGICLPRWLKNGQQVYINRNSFSGLINKWVVCCLYPAPKAANLAELAGFSSFFAR